MSVRLVTQIKCRDQEKCELEIEMYRALIFNNSHECFRSDCQTRLDFSNIGSDQEQNFINMRHKNSN